VPQPKPAKEWITAEEAAALLGVNLRQVQKRARAGYIEKRRLPRLPTESAGRVEYSRADVDALLDGTPNHCEPVGFPQRVRAAEEAEAGSDARPPAAGNGTRALAPAAFFRPPELAAGHWPAPTAPRAWLTLPEAAAYSGLPEVTIVSLTRGGMIRAIDQWGQDVGQGTHRASYRMSRASLDAYGEGKL
jgi:hypothetical protein